MFRAADNDPRYARRLAIIVPYRDRADHLGKFLPHVTAYFQQDKLDRNIRFSIHVIEQIGNDPFNRGRVKNCGFALVKHDHDYVCFHDVDYLPLWADYSWSQSPARLIWHGLTLGEDWENFFGGVVLFDKDAFERVNGYPNCYWGWGLEDHELGERCKLAGLDFERRDGTYMALPHKHAGFSAPGVLTEEARRNGAVFRGRQGNIAALLESDGLNSLAFNVVERRPLSAQGQIIPHSFHYFVDLGALP